MLRRLVGIAKIEIAQVDRQRHRGAQHSHRIALVNGKVTEHEQASQGATFPKAEGDNAFLCAFGGDPLDQEAKTENQAAAEADDFPGMNQDPEDIGFGEKMEAVHNGPRLRQGRALYKPPVVGKRFDLPAVPI